MDERTHLSAPLWAVEAWMTPQEHDALRAAVVVLLDHALQDLQDWQDVASLDVALSGAVSFPV